MRGDLGMPRPECLLARGWLVFAGGAGGRNADACSVRATLRCASRTGSRHHSIREAVHCAGPVCLLLVCLLRPCISAPLRRCPGMPGNAHRLHPSRTVHPAPPCRQTARCYARTKECCQLTPLVIPKPGPAPCCARPRLPNNLRSGPAQAKLHGCSSSDKRYRHTSGLRAGVRTVRVTVVPRCAMRLGARVLGVHRARVQRCASELNFGADLAVPSARVKLDFAGPETLSPQPGRVPFTLCSSARPAVHVCCSV